MSATPDNTDQLLKTYLAEQREWGILAGRGQRVRSPHSSTSSISSADAPVWRIADHGSPDRAIAPNAAVGSPRRRGAVSSPSGSRGRNSTVRNPEGPAMTDSRSPSRDTGSLSMYRLAPYTLPPADGTSYNHSAPSLLIGAQSTPDGRLLVRPLPNSSTGHRDSAIYFMPHVRDPDGDHKRSRSLSSIPPTRPLRTNKGSFYISPTSSPHLSSDGCLLAKNPLPSYLSAPMTPPADVDPLPAPASPTMSSGSESDGLEFGGGDNYMEGKGSPPGNKREQNSSDPPHTKPKALISVPYSAISKSLITVPYSTTSSCGPPALHLTEPKTPPSKPHASTLSLSPRKPLPDEESRGRPRWPRGGQRPSTPTGIRRSNSGSKNKTKVKSNLSIPIPEYKKKPSFSVPSLPSLPPRKKWAVGGRVSGLFSGRIFNRLEVKEIIDTSVKNYESSDPSRRYSRARHTINPLGLTLETSSDSSLATTGTDKKLPPLPQSASLQPPSSSLRTNSAASTRASSRDSMAAERGSPAVGSELGKSDDDSSIRGSFLMDPQSQMSEDEDEEVEVELRLEVEVEPRPEEEDEPPAIDITDDLAMAVAEEEAVLPFQSRNRRLYQNPSLPSIPELSPTIERGNRRLSPISPPPASTPVDPVSSPTATAIAIAAASSCPPPIPPKSLSRPTSLSINTQPPKSPLPTTITITTTSPTASFRSPPTSPTLPHSPTSTRRHSYIVPPPTPTTLRDSRIHLHPPNEPLDWTAFQMAIAGPTGDYLMDGLTNTSGENPDASTSDSLIDWFRSYNFDSVGAMVHPPTEPPSPQHPPTEDFPPPLESDAGSNSNRTSSLLQHPVAELDAAEPPVAPCAGGDGVKMTCNFTDGSLGDYLNWEVNLLQVVDDMAEGLP
ncbi:hypothetical protein FGG08_006101 [Glutinoglossum americanum]|uniref:Uncharacterized protein n=1 Tax=Glutinoglossum americanum TaxID=1670608 RepID=A0A9P8KVC7_9PEZI|nr:hypothetical protein FGG08_006101 [Glutinoglossum americanum]